MAYGLTQSLDLVPGSSQYALRAATGVLVISGSVTVEGWFKFDSFNPVGAGEDDMVSCNQSINTGGWKLVIPDSGGTPRLGFQLGQGGGTNSTNEGNTTLSTGTWYHLAGTWTAGSGNRPHCWVNGVDDGSSSSTTGAGSIASYSQVNIGAFVPGVSGRFMDGKCSLVRVWAADMSASIATNMCTVLGSTTNLSAEWTLDNTDNDNSGNGFTLTRSGGAGFVADVPSVCSVVGPTNLKSFDGNLKANMKSYNGNLLANIKSIDGNS